MSVRVFNTPDIQPRELSDVFRPSESNRDRQFSSGYTYNQDFLGTDLLQLSEDYEPKTNTKVYSSGRSYNKLIRLLMVFAGILAFIGLAVAALVAMGGLIAVIVLAQIVLVTVFLYSINLNPFSKRTYQKIFGNF